MDLTCICYKEHCLTQWTFGFHIQGLSMEQTFLDPLKLGNKIQDGSSGELRAKKSYCPT